VASVRERQAELGEHVADVHVDRPRAEEELARDLAVRPTHCDQTQDLELSACQPAPLQVARRPAAETLVDAFAGRLEIGGGEVGEGARAEFS
jgi:hypothetical protein